MAQIVTITNPLTGQPAQVDQLDHTAQQIDDAIARALPGGDIDMTLQNNDPRNWGLGTETYADIDWNTAVKSGFYSGTTNSPDGGKWFGYVVALEPGYCAQYVFKVRGYRLQQAMRMNRGNEWLAWEYINPLMELGVEYRTTERFLAKPVYQVAFEISELPAAGSVVSKELPVTYSTSSDIKIIGLEGGLLKQGNTFIGLSATDPAHHMDPYTKGWWAYTRENKVYVYSLINLAEVLANGTPKYDKFIIVAKYVRGSF